jgi:hypothetical protein
MTKINFIVGPIGGGSAEIRGVITRNSRNQDLTFEELKSYENNVFSAYVGCKDEVTEDLPYMMQNSIMPTFETQMEMIGNIIVNHADASELFLVGPGVSLFIEQLINRYPYSNVYFAKRIDQTENTEIILKRMTQLKCIVPEGFLSFVNSLNQQLLESSENLMASLGLSWTTGNSYVISEGIDLQEPLPEPKANSSSNEIEDMLHKKVIFLKPTALAVYVPRSGFIDFN